MTTSTTRPVLRFLARDWLVHVFLLVLGAEIAIYAVPLLDPATLDWFGTTAFLVPVVLVVVVAAFEGLSDVPDRVERRFWRWMGLGCLVWLVTASGIAVARFEHWNTQYDIAVDTAYLFFYVAMLLAVELRPNLVDLEGRFRLERRLRWTGLAVFVVGWFAYFVIVPVVVAPDLYETDVPSSLFFITLDLVMVVRFTHLAWTAGSRRWRLLYGTLGAASATLVFTDSLDALVAVGALRFPNGRLTDMVWVTAPAMFLLAFRLKRAPLPARQLSERDRGDVLLGLDPVRVGSLLVTGAFLFPAGHYLLHLGHEYGEALERAMHGVVLGAMCMMGGLAIVAYRRLEAQRAAFERIRAGLEDRLRQAQKLEAVGRVTGAVSHELGRALTAVSRHVDQVVDELGPGHPITEHLVRAQEASRRAADFTRNLLIVSGRRPAVPDPLDLNATLQKAEPDLRDMVGSRVAVNLELAQDAGQVLMGLDAFQTVLTALVMNARDAMPDGGTLRIQTGSVLMDPDRAVAQAVRPGRYGRLLVADTGAGIPNHVMGHLFEPFFTTKDRSGGSGLSLAMAYSLATQHGGQISVRSDEGRGAEFEILLPAIDLPVSSRQASTPS